MSPKPLFHDITRRRFLAAGALGAGVLFCAPKLVRAGGSVRYCAMSPEMNDLAGYTKAEDFGWTASEAVKTVTMRGVDDAHFKGYRTLLTIVDESGGQVRRAWVPGLLHAGCFDGNQVYLVTRGEGAAFYALDVDTLEITAHALPEPGTLFGGHVIGWTQPGHFAVTVNRQELGAYDFVNIYEGKTLKRVDSFSSHGFQAHELALAPDKQTLYVGHYGAYFMSGPYQHFRAEKLVQKLQGLTGNLTYFPGSVAAIGVADHKLKQRLSDKRNGPQGHIAPGSDGSVYLTRFAPRLNPHEDVLNNPLFAAGEADKSCPPEFYNTLEFKSSGTTVVYDNVAQQYLLAATHKGQVVYGSADQPDVMLAVEMTPLHYKKPYGLAFHPDGQHYVVSCDNGFALFQRKTHEYVADRSIALRLGLHSHMCAG